MQQHSSALWYQRIDHLAFAALDLAEGIEYLEDLLGVSVQPGGKHPAWGTHNVLIALGPDIFLEIIAPDPERENPAIPPLFGIDQLSSPKLGAWAAKESHLESRLEKLRQANIPFGPPLAGQRQKPDGTMLNWELSDPLTRVGDGVIPFLIDWGNTPHPASVMPQVCQLLELRIEHPDPDAIKEILGILELDTLPVAPGTEPALIATIQTPGGIVELR